MMGNGMMEGGHMFGGWGGMFFGPLIMIGGFILVVVAIVMLIRGATRTGTRAPTTNRAMDILKERFAAGEIDATEFESRKRILEQ